MNDLVDTKAKHSRLTLRATILYLIPLVYITKLLNTYYIMVHSAFETPFRLLSILANAFMLCLFIYVVFSYCKSPQKMKALKPFLFMMILILAKALKLYIQNPFFMSREYLFEVIKPWGVTYVEGYYYQEMMTNLTSMVLVAATFILIRYKKEFKTVIFIGVIAFLVPIFLTLLKNFNLIGQRVTYVDGLKFGGSIWNIGMHSYVSLFWLAVFIYKKSSSVKKVWIAFLLFGTIVTSIAGLSRTFVLVFAISLIYYFKHERHTLQRILISNVVLIFIILILLTDNFISNELFSRFSEFRGVSDQMISNVRFDIWKVYLSYLKESWAFGIPVNLHSHIRGEALGFAPHSIVLSWFIAYGILGVLCFMYMVKNLYIIIKKMSIIEVKNYNVSALYCWLISYLLVACFNDTGYREASIYISMGIVLALSKVNIEKKQE